MARAATFRLPYCGSILRMNASRTIADLEADLAALRASAERAGTALACLFSTSDEFEAEVVRVRREQGAFRALERKRSPWWVAAVIGALSLAFLLI
jgi:hypothetical protein